MKTIVAFAAATAILMAVPAAGQDLRPVSVGTLSSLSDAPLYIAHAKGWFEEEGLDVSLTPFDSAARMVAPLGAGQLDVGAGSASAGLYNAVSRGIEIRIVADKASSREGYGANKLLIRRDLVEDGSFSELSDIAGLNIGMTAPGVSNSATLNAALTSIGLQYSDVETTDMPFAQHVVALENRSIDGSVTIEPYATIAVRRGLAEVVGTDDEYIPNHQTAVLIYSERFAGDREAATAFMRAYLRGMRYYNDALEDSRFVGEAGDDVIAIIGQYTPFQDADVLGEATPVGMDPDGAVDRESLVSDYEFYRSQGLIEGEIDFDTLIDTSFAEEAAAELGPYQRAE